jgi:peptidoglycan L-alanyl-D-glutamate endopeptidase CwlK
MSRDLDLLHPTVKAKTLALLKLTKERNINIIITQTLRTAAEQEAFYARGRLPLATVNSLYKKLV